MHEDLSMVPPSHFYFAQEIARGLGPRWKVEAILDSPLVVHPLGLRVMLHRFSEYVRLTSHVGISSNPQAQPEEVAVDVPLTKNSRRDVVHTIRTHLLPHYGRQDAVAGLRVLALPLQDAGLPAIAQGTRACTTIDYVSPVHQATADFNDAEQRPLFVRITSRGDDTTRVSIRIPYLSEPAAARLASSALPAVYAAAPAAGNLHPGVHELTEQLPGLRTRSRPAISGARQYTDLVDPTGVVAVRHTVAAHPEDPARTWAELWIRGASVATAFAVLSAYAAT
ncbi:hypothetical protein [Streptomyces sp. NPDC058672]|uniref:hypothetical protein n=1 Tax=Streptomyces sp. NPDC058672 TaxID=3346591 RepID=UPI0036504ADE